MNAYIRETGHVRSSGVEAEEVRLRGSEDIKRNDCRRLRSELSTGRPKTGKPSF